MAFEKAQPSVEYDHLTSYVSDCVENALNLAGMKGQNQLTWRDISGSVEEIWAYCYEKIVAICPGYFSRITQLKRTLTHMPPYVQSTLRVFELRPDSSPYDIGDRRLLRPAGQTDMNASGVYYTSGFDIYCRQVELNNGMYRVYVEYTPEAPLITTTFHSRDPHIVPPPKGHPYPYEYTPLVAQQVYGPWLAVYRNAFEASWDAATNKVPFATAQQAINIAQQAVLNADQLWLDGINNKVSDTALAALEAASITAQATLASAQAAAETLITPGISGTINFQPRGTTDPSYNVDLTDLLINTYWNDDADNFMWRYKIISLFCDYPYIFITYRDERDNIFQPCISMIFRDVCSQRPTWNKYNAFDFLGTAEGTNVQFLKAKHNDYTGMGVTILDNSDGRYKELGWTHDAIVEYPSRILVHYFTAQLAKRFADLNNSQIQAVDSAVASSNVEMQMFLKRDQSGWQRIENVQRLNLGDFL